MIKFYEYALCNNYEQLNTGTKIDLKLGDLTLIQ